MCLEHLTRWGTVAVALAIATACGRGDGLTERSPASPSVAPAAESVAGYRVLEPGAFTVGFPTDPLDMRSELQIGRGWDLAVGDDEIYVLDAFSKHVLSLDWNAKLRAVIGGVGEGPGEFENPYSIEPDPRGGVWVADLRLGRLSRFDSDGNLLEHVRVPQLVRGFTVMPNGALLYRKFDGRTVTLTLQSGDDAVDLAGELPPELTTPGDLQSLWAEYDLEFAVVAPDTVVAFRNTDVRAYGAWRIALDIAAARIIDVAPLHFPAWLTEEIAAEAQEIEQESRGAGGGDARRPGASSTVIPFSRGVRMSMGELWVTPHSAANLALATTIPLAARDSVSVVVREGHQKPSGCVGIDYAVVGLRLAELCMEQLRIYKLLPAAPGPPPFAVGPM